MHSEPMAPLAHANDPPPTRHGCACVAPFRYICYCCPDTLTQAWLAGTMWQPRTPKVPTFKTAAGHLLVQPLINGRHVGWLLVDTGASSMVVQPEVADALEMPAFGTFKVNAVGGNIDTRYRVAQSFQLGPLIMEECAPSASSLPSHCVPFLARAWPHTGSRWPS